MICPEDNYMTEEVPAKDRKIDLLNEIDGRFRSDLKGKKYNPIRNAYYNSILPAMLNMQHNGGLLNCLEIVAEGLNKDNLSRYPNFLVNVANVLPYALNNPEEFFSSSKVIPLSKGRVKRISYDPVKELSEDDDISFEGSLEDCVKAREEFAFSHAY